MKSVTICTSGFEQRISKFPARMRDKLTVLLIDTVIESHGINPDLPFSCRREEGSDMWTFEQELPQ